MTEPRENKAQDSSIDNSGVDPILSGIDATSEAAPDTESGVVSEKDLIAEAEEIIDAAAAAMDAESDAEAVEAEILDGEDAEAEAAEAEAEAADAPDADAVMAAAAEALAAAKAEAADWQGRYMRLHAEWDTYRRRTAEERKEEKARATEKLVGELLPLLDDFERTIAYAQTNGEAGLLGGVEAVSTKFVNILTKVGVETIDPAGQPFDALEAQAVAMVPDTDAYDETVAQVYQKGYKMGGHVLRPAMVTVTTGGPKRPAPEEA